jgi:hypothetical protein
MKGINAASARAHAQREIRNVIVYKQKTTAEQVREEKRGGSLDTESTDKPNVM